VTKVDRVKCATQNTDGGYFGVSCSTGVQNLTLQSGANLAVTQHHILERG
jgi:hypothetical protein